MIIFQISQQSFAITYCPYAQKVFLKVRILAWWKNERDIERFWVALSFKYVIHMPDLKNISYDVMYKEKIIKSH